LVNLNFPRASRMQGMERQTTPSIAGQTSLHKSLSPQKEKSRIAIKNSSTKPNKFHSKYVCFSGRKTLKIRLCGFPETLVYKGRSQGGFTLLIGPFEFERALTTRPSTGNIRD